MDTWQMIDNVFTKTMKPFYDQVDITRKRLNLTPFKLKDYPGPDGAAKPLDDVINVTENKSVAYMKRIVAGLMAAKWQGVVEGSITKREEHKIELFNEACLGQADEYLLTEYGMASLDTWLANHACHTPILIVQWMASIEDGEYKVHCLPCDARYTPFVLNKWVAPITYRDKEDLLRELERYEKLAVDSIDGDYAYKLDPTLLKDTDNEVRDFWDSEKGELWINKNPVFRQPNTYRKLPFVIMKVPSGFQFRDKGYLEHESPSAIWLNEGLYEQISHQMSIDATIAFGVVNPAYEKEVDTIAADQKSDPAPERGTSKDVLKGQRHIPLPTPDINQAELASRNQVSGMIDAAAPMAPRAYQTPPSAIEVATEVELNDQLQNPQVIALQMFKSQLARLNIEQTILMAGQEGGSMLVGRTGKQANFSIGDLKDPKKYAINYQLMKQNKRLAIINEQRYIALKAAGAPEEYLLKDVLGVEDPAGWMRAMTLQKAEALNPALTYKRMALDYAEKADDATDEIEKADYRLSWKLMVHEYVQIMRQRMSGLPTNEAQNIREATRSKGGNTPSLLGQAAAGGRLPQLTGAQKGVTL